MGLKIPQCQVIILKPEANGLLVMVIPHVEHQPALVLWVSHCLVALGHFCHWKLVFMLRMPEKLLLLRTL